MLKLFYEVKADIDKQMETTKTKFHNMVHVALFELWPQTLIICSVNLKVVLRLINFNVNVA